MSQDPADFFNDLVDRAIALIDAFPLTIAPPPMAHVLGVLEPAVLPLGPCRPSRRPPPPWPRPWPWRRRSAPIHHVFSRGDLGRNTYILASDETYWRYADAFIWPRGLPLDKIHEAPPPWEPCPKLLGGQELPLLEAWLSDLRSITPRV